MPSIIPGTRPVKNLLSWFNRERMFANLVSLIVNPEKKYIHLALVVKKTLDTLRQLSKCLIVVNKLFKALADPTRREILDLLKEKDLSAGEIAANFSMQPASISHHLALLQNADLVSAEKKGKYIIYSLNTTVFHEIMEWVISFQKGKN